MTHNSIVKLILFIFTFTVCLLYSSKAAAQENNNTAVADTLFRVVMNDGNTFTGKIIEIDEEKVILKTTAVGIITLHRKYIKSIERVDSLESGIKNTRELQLHSTRYLFASSAYGMEKGDSYYQNILVFYNQYSIGITDRFSMSFGTMPFFLLAGSPTPVWITPKYSFPLVKEKVNLSIEVMIGDILFDDNGLGVLPHATVSFGPIEKNISIGVGYFFVESQLIPYPLIDISGIIRVSRRTFLMAENHLISDGNYFTGISILGIKSIIANAALSYGLALPFSTDFGGEIIAMPWIGLTLPFTKSH